MIAEENMTWRGSEVEESECCTISHTRDQSKYLLFVKTQYA